MGEPSTFEGNRMKAGKLYELKSGTVRSVLCQINDGRMTGNSIVFEQGDVVMAMSRLAGSIWGIYLYGDKMVMACVEHFQEVAV